MAAITWLHLSDWHQKGKDFDRDVVRDALIKDIKNRKGIDGSLEKIDFVVFSGDVAYHGKAEEYQAAITEFFDPILKATGIECNRLIIVPGNHDLERAALDVLPSDLGQRLSMRTTVNEWLTDDRRRRALLAPMDNYSQFVTNYLGKNVAGPEPAYGSVRQFEVEGKKIAVIGLNSAWLCARHKEGPAGKEEVNDYGHLIVGEPQVREALHASADADVRIAVLHHPFDWLAPTDTLAEKNTIRRQLSKQCHFILHGHEHDSDVSASRSITGDSVIVSAGASYDRPETLASRYANGYNFVHLDLATWRGTVYLRCYEDRRREWVCDTGAIGKVSGYWEFTMKIVTEDGDKTANGAKLIQPPSEKFDSQWLNLENPNQVVKLQDRFYVRRRADEELEKQVERPGTVTTIRAPRQTGKSSLLVRSVHHALETGARVIMCDLQMVDKAHLESLEAFLRCMAESIVMKLGLNSNRFTEIWGRKWVSQNGLTDLMENYVLPASENRLVLAMDEVDRLLTTPFRDDFFSMLRAWCNNAAYQEPWDKLSILMAIATEPWSFIQDVRQSPFNVGLRLVLDDFNEFQIRDLNQRHSNPVSGENLPRLMGLLHGHPYLTRQALYTLVREGWEWEQLNDKAGLDSGPFSDHLKYYYWLLQDFPEQRQAFRQVIEHNRCADADTFHRLERVGLVRGTAAACECRCELYRRYFKDKL